VDDRRLISTERWVRCSLGHDHWGSEGAAGLLLAHRDDESSWVLLQHRAAWTHHGDTWSLPGGAIRQGESAVDAAFREVAEETGLVLAGEVDLLGTFVDDHGGWAYTTICASSDVRLDPATPLDAPWAIGRQEQELVTWVRASEVVVLPLHPGFAASWPEVSRLIDPELHPRHPNG
jgi:8-oxo-dGTP diphosphatase